MKRVAGIDIGNHSIKLIELEDRRGHLGLTAHAVSPITNGDVKSTLKELVALKKLSVKRVNVSLAGPSVIVRYIEMPPMKSEELKSAIKFEAEKYIPFSIKESIIDCAMLDKTSSGSQRVLLVATKKDGVGNLLGLFKEMGLEINAIDIDSFAFLNSFQRSTEKDKKDEDTYSLINIGARFSNMNILTKGNVYFTRDIIWGGADITDRIKGAMGISLEEAEMLKHKPAEKREDVVKLIMPALERLISQIRISFDYFESQFGKNIKRLYISGGTAYLFNIVDFLKDSLDIDTVMWNPFEGIKVLQPIEEIEKSPALFAVAVGLALRR